MADNKTVRDGANATFTGAADELSDSSFSPKVTLLDGSGSPTPISPAKAGQLPAALTAAGNLKIAVLETVSSTTGTTTSVSGSATSVVVLAANTSRRGATVYNDSTATLYLRLAVGSASTTAHTVQLVAGAYYELPFGYPGEVNGIWGSATGAARVTEFT